jgi:hypothetical protein
MSMNRIVFYFQELIEEIHLLPVVIVSLMLLKVWLVYRALVSVNMS